jgi:hypothetical protein
MLLLTIILVAWLVLSAMAMLLCLAARRTDGELVAGELAPVIELHPSAVRRHSHSPAA